MIFHDQEIIGQMKDENKMLLGMSISAIFVSISVVSGSLRNWRENREIPGFG